MTRRLSAPGFLILFRVPSAQRLCAVFLLPWALAGAGNATGTKPSQHRHPARHQSVHTGRQTARRHKRCRSHPRREVLPHPLHGSERHSRIKQDHRGQRHSSCSGYISRRGAASYIDLDTRRNSAINNKSSRYVSKYAVYLGFVRQKTSLITQYFDQSPEFAK